MATSSTDDYYLTRDQLIRSAFEIIGVAVANEPLSAEDNAVGVVALNAMCFSWMTYGLHLWKRGRSSVTLVANTYSYSLAPTLGSGTEKVMRILECNRVDSNNNTIDLNRLSLQEYENLPNPSSTGIPIHYYFEPTRTASTLYIWPAPDSTAAAEYTIDYVYQKPIEDMEDVDFPKEWYDAIITNLAYKLAPRYGIDINHLYLLRKDAQETLAMALSYDQEDTSIFIKPRTY